jgi:ribonuclease D
MKNITLALDEKTIKAGRDYARKHNLTLNSLIRRLLQQTVSQGSLNWVDECFSLMDKAEVSPYAKKWEREELYRV